MRVRKIRVMVILGTRPEAIKMAPVIKELEMCKRAMPIVVTTSQHRRIQDDILDLFGIRVDHDLNIMRRNQTLIGTTSRALSGVYKAISKFNPDFVLIQGDTTTAFMGALAAFYKQTPVGHVEAGLRTFQKYNPFPEEKNRQLISSLADMHFAPTKISRDNLLRENIAADKIILTGNTVIDALLWARKSESGFFPKDARLRQVLSLPSRKIILVTAHRRENWGLPLKNISLALIELAKRNPEVEIVYPVHPHPNVRKVVNKFLQRKERIHLLEPVSYESFVVLMQKAYMVLTDSGGVQEEASCLGKPVLVLRKYTERSEGLQSKTLRLVGTEQARIVSEAARLLREKKYYRQMCNSTDAFGDGKSAQRIVRAIIAYFRRQGDGNAAECKK